MAPAITMFQYERDLLRNAAGRDVLENLRVVENPPAANPPPGNPSAGPSAGGGGA